MKPIVAIVGRPNVGKSTLFNRIAGERRSLVDDRPGVTRDRIYHHAVWDGREFILVDTGGFEPGSQEPLLAGMRQQTELAIREADVILLLVDGRDGVMPSDRDTADLLRRTAKPVHVVVNKVDGPRHDALAAEFFELGTGRLHAVSARHGRGVTDLLDDLTRDFPAGPEAAPSPEEGIRVAVVGRPNVGKSSLVNRLCGGYRSLVSPVPGTTRDAVDTPIRWYGKPFLLVDTAGIRRRSRTTATLERYSVVMSLRSIDRCDVAFLVLDAAEGPTDQDGAIGEYVVERGKGCILVANKWDLLSKVRDTFGSFEARVRRELRHLEFAPLITVSAASGQRVGRLLRMVERAHEAARRRVPTARLNERLRVWTGEQPPPRHRRRPVNLYFISQPEVCPPAFVLFSNAPEGVTPTYRRYLSRRIREDFDFEGTPIRLFIRARGADRR
jgi:GTP-binding protein